MKAVSTERRKAERALFKATCNAAIAPLCKEIERPGNEAISTHIAAYRQAIGFAMGHHHEGGQIVLQQNTKHANLLSQLHASGKTSHSTGTTHVSATGRSGL